MTKPNQTELWLSSVAYEHSRSKYTDKEYRRVWKAFSTFAETTGEEIIADYEASNDRMFKRKYGQLIRGWIQDLSSDKPNEKAKANGSISVYVGVVKSFFKYNDLPLGHIPQTRVTVTYHNKDITKEEINKILAHVPIRERAFFAFIAQSGLRPYTITQLKIENLPKILTPNIEAPIEVYVPNTIEKGKYGNGHWAFIGEEAIKYTKQYLDTRHNLTPQSLLFSLATDENLPVNPKNISRTFKDTAIKLQKNGVLNYKVEKGKPSELRLYNLRKYFRKFAHQMGEDELAYIMNHTAKGASAKYIPKEMDYYKQLYIEKAMPFLRFETATPTETDKLRTQYEKELQNIESKYKQENEELKARIQQNEAQIERLRTDFIDKLQSGIKELAKDQPPATNQVKELIDENMKLHDQLDDALMKNVELQDAIKHKVEKQVEKWLLEYEEKQRKAKEEPIKTES